jgi:hypothetical protein
MIEIESFLKFKKLVSKTKLKVILLKKRLKLKLKKVLFEIKN